MRILFLSFYFIYHIIFIYSIDIQPDLPIIRSCSFSVCGGCFRFVFWLSMISNIVFTFSGSSIASSNRNLSSKFNSFNDFLWFISSSPLLYRYNTCKEELFSFMHMITQIFYIYQYIPLSSFIRHVFICFLWFSSWILTRLFGLEINELVNIDALQILEFICVLIG